MKPIHASLLLMAGLLVLINSPLRAQEKPADPATQPAAKPEPPPPPSERGQPAPPPPGPRGEREYDRDRERERPRGGQARSTEEKAVPFIGVLTTGVSPELRAQFGLQEGFGLQVVEVMPDTPAKAAGLKEHDILVTFEDQKLVNMDQLQTLVRSKKKDDQVSLTVISGGQRSQVTITIGERMMPVNAGEPRGRGGNNFYPMNPRSYGYGGYGYDRQDDYRSGARELQETLERFKERMRDYQKRLEEWSRDRSGEMPKLPLFEGGRHRDGDRRESYDPRADERNGPGPSRYSERREYQSGSISRRDESGEYQLRRDNDRTVFTVRPKEGAEQSWNVNEEADRAAIPEQYRAKLKMLEDIRKDMHKDGERRSGPGSGESAPGKELVPLPEKPRDGATPPPPGSSAPSRKGGTI